jgi:hypothetical protein
MHKLLVLAMLFVAACATVTVACGNTVVGGAASETDSGATTGGNGNGTDGGGGSSASGDDAGGGGSSSNTESDGGLTYPDGAPAVAPTGTLLVPSTSASVSVVGVTSDDYAVYLDTSTATPSVGAISLAAGSKPISLGVADNNDNVIVAGKVVVFENDGNGSGVGHLYAWTSAASAPALLSSSSCSAVPGDGQVAASADGKYVLFFDGVDTNCATGTLTVAATDGSSKTALVPQIDLGGNLCSLMLAFGGDTAVAGYCVTGGDGGVVIDASLPGGGTTINVGTVSAFSPPSFAKVQLVVGAQPGITVDPAGTQVVLVDNAGTVAYPLDGGAPVTIDPLGQLGNETGMPGVLTSDAGALLYTTTNLNLARASTTAPSNPVALSDAGAFSDIFAVSPSQSWVVGSLNTYDFPAVDLFLSSTSTPGPITTLAGTATGMLSGDPFTADSSRALFFSNAQSNGSGTLTALPLAGGGAPAVVAANAVTAFSPSGTKVVFSGNFDPNEGVADLFETDVATTAAPKLLVSMSDPYPYLNAEKTMIVYAWSFSSGAYAGLWAKPIP